MRSSLGGVVRSRIVVALIVLSFIFMLSIRSNGHAVPANSVREKHKTASRSISQGLGLTTVDITEAVYVGELLSGLVGAYAGAMTGLMITGMPGSEKSRTVVLSIYYSMTAIGAATGTAFVGICFKQKGSFTGALIGSALGVAAAVLCKDILPPLLFCPCASAGAVLGYNYKTFFGE